MGLKAVKFFVGSDHFGFKLKEEIERRLKENGFEVEDVGVDSDAEKVDYPDYAFPLGEKVAAEGALGILACGTGAGVTICANKVPGVRAVLVFDEEQARNAKIHNNANVLCFGAMHVAPELAFKSIRAWLDAEFDNSPRRLQRLQKITEFEEKCRS